MKKLFNADIKKIKEALRDSQDVAKILRVYTLNRKDGLKDFPLSGHYDFYYMLLELENRIQNIIEKLEEK